MKMEEIKRVIKRFSEKGRTTTFYTDDGKPYTYVILPLEARAEPIFIKACVEGIEKLMKEEIKKSNTVLAIESKGFIITPIIAMRNGLRWVAVRKRNYNIPDQFVFHQKKAFKGGTELFCVGLKRNDRVILIDDIFSSGGTVINTVEVLMNCGIKINGICAIYTRGNGLEEIKKKFGLPTGALARIELIEGKPKITEFFIKE
jgi:adenine phosphoribosyltransferase